MPRPRLKTILDMADQANRQRLMQWIGRIREGWFEVEIIPRRGTKTQQQLGYYYGVILHEFHLWAKEQGNDWQQQQCHEYLKSLFLTEPLIDKRTGEIVREVVRSLADLAIDEMSEYIERCIAYLATECNVIVPPPDQYGLTPAAKGK